MPSEYTPTGARRSGDDYQDIVALEIFIEMLESPRRYVWVQLEADEAGFLDDIFALKGDGSVMAKQVKFSAHPDREDDHLSWEYLLDGGTSPKGKPRTSPLLKWSNSYRELGKSHHSVDASLVSNRRPDSNISYALRDQLIDFDRIADPSIRGEIVKQLGSEDLARSYFSMFRFDLAAPDLDTFENGVRRRFERLGGNAHGWKNLKDEVRRWIRNRNVPPPDGKITLTDVRRASLWQELKSLPEEFVVPEDFVIPSETFHSKFVDTITRTPSGYIVLCATPGVGKSTYLSHIFHTLASVTPTIRHHYFLSSHDTTPSRTDHTRVCLSLMNDLQKLLPDALRAENPSPESLGDWLSTAGLHLSKAGKKIVLILDGLDHVWRDTQSVSDLDHLFRLLGPKRDGVLVILGTQPVDRAVLPTRLAQIAPRDSWHELPTLDFLAVRRWMLAHAQDFDISDEEKDSYRLAELAGDLLNKSEGHPLYLRYILKQLKETGQFITSYAIRQLPPIPHRDIAEYYRQLWESLPDESKQILLLLAMCDFPWSRGDIADCIDPGDLQIDAAIRKISHLTTEHALGLSFAHSSLAFFVTSLSDYSEYGPRIRGLALAWIKNRGPEFVRWAYEWLLADESGDSEPLLQGPSRIWLVQAMAKGYPHEHADRILGRAAELALQKGRLARFVELALLSDYLSDGIHSRDHIVQDLLWVQLSAGSDPQLADRVIGQIQSLGGAELRALAEYCAVHGQTDLLSKCFDRLNDKLRSGAGHVGLEDASKAILNLIEVGALCDNVPPDSMVNYLLALTRRMRKNDSFGTDVRFCHQYFIFLRKHLKVSSMRRVMERTRRWPELARRPIVAQFTMLAIEEAFDPFVDLTDRDRADPFFVVWRCIMKDCPADTARIRPPDPQVLRLKDYEHYKYYADMAEYLWQLFFALLANHLLDRSDDCEAMLHGPNDNDWLVGFTSHSSNVARSLAIQIRARAPVNYGWIFEQFRDFKLPGHSDRTARGFGIAARRMLFRLSFDLLVLQTSLRTPTITADDVALVHGSGLFLLQTWLDEAVAVARPWMSEDGLKAALALVESDLETTIDYFDSRAELCASAAKLAVRHKSRPKAETFLSLAWSNIVAYGFHKDMLWHQCLEIVETLQRTGHTEHAQRLILQMAPAIADVGEYTDGDETRDFPRKLGRLLATIDLNWFSKYHEWLCERSEYYDAEAVITSLIKVTDLNEPFLAAVASTGIDSSSLSAVATRAQTGEASAMRCLKNLQPFGTGPVRRKQPESNPALLNSGESIELTRFPPTQFDEFLVALKQTNSYRTGEHIDRWAKYWSRHGEKTAVLHALETSDKDPDGLFRDLNFRFQLTLEVRGKNEAYPELVRAMRNSGWNRYISKHEDVVYRWLKMRELYSDRWLDFLRQTIIGNSTRTRTYDVTAASCVTRIVEYLLLMQKPDDAIDVANAAISSANAMVPLKLHQPRWVKEIQDAA